MKILIWGIPCVGKSEAGKLLAEKLNYNFFDMNELIKKKYGTIDKFHEKYPDNYENFKEKERIAKEIINNNDNFVMTVTLIYNKEIVNNITNTDTISVELTDDAKSIFNRILFYDENDEVIPNSKEYLEMYKEHYMKEIKIDKITSTREYKNIPKFKIKNRKFEDIIDELSEYIITLNNERNKEEYGSKKINKL